MSKMINISVERRKMDKAAEAVLESYAVPEEKGGTVLGALQYIYDNYDSTLAFRLGCRAEDCGLCAVDVNGRPRLSCHTALGPDMVVRPLQKLPVVCDLVVERDWIVTFLRRFELFLGDGTVGHGLGRLMVADDFRKLRCCTECLSCLSACPSFEFGRDDLGGPYHFLKLAQMHWDPRDGTDRRAQAATLGIGRCADCRKCYCPSGVPIYRSAIAPLLGKKAPNGRATAP